MEESKMAAIRGTSASGIARPAPNTNVLRAREKLVSDRGLIARPQQWAPAWFYSALNWLGKTYYDANHAAQSFNSYMAGSDVDPYQDIGSTRLFRIVRVRETFRLSIAPDADSLAPSSGGTTYPNTDAGIREMYLALADSPVFARLKYCYVPARIGLDLDPNRGEELENGYDPATGLRAVVLGTAVSQVVPLDDFIKTRNEQIYNPNPTIVPLVTALVYDVTLHNTLGAKTFTLPAFYTRDRLSAGTDGVDAELDRRGRDWGTRLHELHLRHGEGRHDVEGRIARGDRRRRVDAFVAVARECVREAAVSRVLSRRRLDDLPRPADLGLRRR